MSTGIYRIVFYTHTSFNFLSKLSKYSFSVITVLIVLLDGGPLEKILLLKGHPPKSIENENEMKKQALNTLKAHSSEKKLNIGKFRCFHLKRACISLPAFSNVPPKSIKLKPTTNETNIFKNNPSQKTNIYGKGDQFSCA